MNYGNKDLFIRVAAQSKSGSFIYEWYKGMPSARWIANNMGDVEVYENVVYELLK